MESIYSCRATYEREREKVVCSGLSEENKASIARFCSCLFSEGCSEQRVVKLSTQLRKIGGWLCKEFGDATENDLRELVAKINTLPHLSEVTKADYRRLLVQFYKWFEGSRVVRPPKVAWIKIKERISGKEGLDLITPDELRVVLDRCDTVRDRAFLSLLYEGGFRIGEILGMKLRDFENGEDFGRVSVTGKTGPRRVVVFTSLPHLTTYLSFHPFRHDPHAYLWLSFSSYRCHQRLMYAGAVKLVERAFARAGITKKRLYLHLFRHSRATELASHLTEAQMKQYFGWAKNSDTPATYVHLSGRDVEQAMMRYYGTMHVN